MLTDKAERLAREMASQATTLDDLNGLMRAMMKSALERMLHSEMDHHLKTSALPSAPTGVPGPSDNSLSPPAAKRNRRNGHSQKTVQGDLGSLTLETPRDRQGTFAPKLIPKHQRRIPGFDEKILALYAKGMTTRDIQEIVKDLPSIRSGRSSISMASSFMSAGKTAECRSIRCMWRWV